MEIIKKEIPGFPKYYACNNGEIWSEKTHRFLKKNLTKDGYFRVGLTRGMETRQYLVHRLIAQTFLPVYLLPLLLQRVDFSLSLL